MKVVKIFSLVLLFCFGLIFVPRSGSTGDDADQAKEECCGWTAGETSVSVLSPEERKRRLGAVVPDWYDEWWEQAEKIEAPKGASFPTRFDWRDSDGVTPAKDQGDCGSCWAFCALGALEAHVKIYGETEMDLSEQQLVSCTNDGCNGGWMTTAYNLFRTQGSIKEECMPYQASDDPPCIQHLCEKWAKISHHSAVGSSVDAIKNIVYNYGPMAVGMAAPDTLSYYTSGCFDYTYFGINHGVLLVGWDDTLCHGEGAWIAKNSWGRNWGMDGFFYIKWGVCQIGYNPDQIFYIYHRPLVRLEDYGVDDAAGGNGDGRPEPGETVRLDFTLKNVWSPLGDVEVVATPDTDGIVMTDDYSYLGSMASKDVLDNSSDPM
jgi:C1A family cysteine protease